MTTICSAYTSMLSHCGNRRLISAKIQMVATAPTATLWNSTSTRQNRTQRRLHQYALGSQGLRGRLLSGPISQRRTVSGVAGVQRVPSAQPCRSVVVKAKPRAKLPERTVKVLCSGCKTALYKYHKNGKGQLVKCWRERIAEDYTNQDLKCPKCGQQFARLAMIRGLPANKIIGGKVITK